MRLGTVVLLHGSVKGMEREADCEILARRIIVSPGREQNSFCFCTYTDCSILGAPSDFPDGEYTASFEGYTFQATCQHGLWLSCGPASRNPQIPVFDD